MKTVSKIFRFISIISLNGQTEMRRSSTMRKQRRLFSPQQALSSEEFMRVKRKYWKTFSYMAVFVTN